MAPSPTTFQERYCSRTGIPLEDFEKHVLRRTFYPAAKVASLVLTTHAELFRTDREFIAAVSRVTGLKTYFHEANQFTLAQENRQFFRRNLRMRVSVRRLTSIAREAFLD